MFKRTTVELTVPSQAELGRVDEVRRRYLSYGTLGSEEDAVYQLLAVDVALAHNGSLVQLDAANDQKVMYGGPAGEHLVFGIPLWDRDDPGWLKLLLPSLRRWEVPMDGEAVHIVAPNAPGQRCSALLGVWCGDADARGSLGVMPMDDECIQALMNLIV